MSKSIKMMSETQRIAQMQNVVLYTDDKGDGLDESKTTMWTVSKV